MTEFKTDASKDRYELTFTTDNEEYYHRMQNEARRCVDDSQNTDMVFECYECGHYLFVETENKTAIDVANALKKSECPSCGRDSSGNWSFVRMGNYKKEYGKKEKDND